MIKQKDLVKSSVAEFLGCWALGGKATLTLDTESGVTTVSFTTTLPGHPEAPLHPPTLPAGPPQHPQPRPRRHRGQAQRERDRLRAARHQAALAGALPPSTTPPLAAAPVAPSTLEALRNPERSELDNLNISNFSEPMMEQQEQKFLLTNNDSDTIPQLDGQAEGERNDKVKKDNEPVQHEESNIAKKCCPLCNDDAVYLKTESEFKTHILNYHEQMQVLKTFGKEWIEENTRHFFFMDKNRRKIWKKFMNDHG